MQSTPQLVSMNDHTDDAVEPTQVLEVCACGACRQGAGWTPCLLSHAQMDLAMGATERTGPLAAEVCGVVCWCA